MIFAGPGIPEGERRDDYVYLLDIYPTLCDLLGIASPDSAEGQSLKGVMDDANAQVRETLFTAYCEYQRMVKDDRFKLIEYVVDGRRTTQLYDLQNDPLEMNNLAADAEYGDRLASLREILIWYRDEWGDRETRWGRVFWEGYGGS